MNNIIKSAIEILKDENLTCVITDGIDFYKSRDRGVKPLIELLDDKQDVSGCSAVDKVVGKGAAILYVLLKVKTVYAFVISEKAKEILENNNIEVEYESIVPLIKNRDKTGFCPIETAVKDITDPIDGLIKIRQKLKELR